MKCSVASPGQGAEDSDQEDTRGTERAPDAVAPDAALHKELVHPVAVRAISVGHHGLELAVMDRGEAGAGQHHVDHKESRRLR